MRLTDARRWLVVGNSGSGKTTLARRIHASLGVAHLELDAVHWQAGWTQNPRFVDEVTEWTRLTPEQLQMWRERLSALLSDERGEIIN